MPFNRSRLDQLLIYIATVVSPNISDELDKIYIELEDRITDLEKERDALNEAKFIL